MQKDLLHLKVGTSELFNKSTEEIYTILASVEQDTTYNSYAVQRRKLKVSPKTVRNQFVKEGCKMFLKETKKKDNVRIAVNKHKDGKLICVHRKVSALEKLANLILTYPLNGKTVKQNVEKFLIKEESKPKEIKLTNLKELQLIR